MKYSFEEDKLLKSDEIEVVVKGQSLTQEAQNLLDYLEMYQQDSPKVIPIKAIDRIQLLKVADIILIDVNDSQLILETINGNFKITERLYRFSECLNNPDFVQVSKHAVININHLDYLEDGFSGSMTAFLTNQLKVSVSRKYLKNLSVRLGL